MHALLVVGFASYFALALLTVIGSRRRGDSGAMTAAACLAFPIAWTAWYVQDELLSRGRALRS